MDIDIANLKRTAASSDSLEDISAYARARKRAGLITDMDVSNIMNRAALGYAMDSREQTNAIHLENFPNPRFWGYREGIIQKDSQNIEEYNWEYPYDPYGEQESVMYFSFRGVVPVVFTMYPSEGFGLDLPVHGLEGASNMARRIAGDHIQTLVAKARGNADIIPPYFSSELEHVMLFHIAAPTYRGRVGDDHLISYWRVAGTGYSEPFVTT